MIRKLLLVISISCISFAVSSQEEQVTVVGTLIKGTPIDGGSPIQKIDSEDIAAQGNLNIVELIKMVPGSSGMDGESNQFGSNAAEGLSNVNLRGLGTNRTLVLINGKRQVTAPLSTGAGRSVNLHDIPMGALRSIEILKEGAAATYGSDAIAGVVNFITDSTFEGFRANIAGKNIPDADDESREFSLTYGTLVGDTNVLMSLGYQFKGQLAARDTDYAMRSWADNLGGGAGGWSTMGNPGTFVWAGGGPLGFSFLPDPGCAQAGGTVRALGGFGTSVTADAAVSGFCLYQYSYFDNVQEEQENTQLWLEANGDIGESSYRAEFLYSTTDVPNWATSPSYPPNNPATNTIPDNHPGMTQLCTDHASWCARLIDDNYGGDGTNRSDVHRLRTRVMGAAGNPFAGSSRGAQLESREYETMRMGFSFDGALSDEVDYSANLTYSNSEGELTSSDTQQHKFLSALWGYGGPNCDVELTALTTSATDFTPQFRVDSTDTAIAAATVKSTTRPTGCQYVNPLSNSVQQGMQRDYSTGDRVAVNPNYEASLANSPELLRYLIDQRVTVSESTLLTFDFITQGTLPNLSFDGGDAAWAVGLERREYNIKTTTPSRAGPTSTNELTDIHNGVKYPCDIPANNETAAGRAACSANPVGLFMFLAPTFEFDQDQNINALFGELALPFSDTFDMQLALRYEDYGDDSTVDPKVVMRWTPLDAVTLRFTGQTTFRAPHPDETSPTRVTALQYVSQAGAFKGVDLTGNPNLNPEEATTYNFGIVTDFGTDNWTATVDYYNFEFDNPIISENYAQLMAAYASGGTAKAKVQSQIYGGTATLVNDGSFAASAVARITSNYVNGPATETDGIDLFIQYETDYADGTIAAGIEASEILDYSVDAYIVDGVEIAAAYECAGYFNISNTCRSMPSTKAKAFANYKDMKHNLYVAANFIGDYTDRRSSPDLIIDEHLTLDATYSYALDDEIDLSLSIYNLTDELPPVAAWEMNYDPNTHSPLGRFIKAGFTYKIQ